MKYMNHLNKENHEKSNNKYRKRGKIIRAKRKQELKRKFLIAGVCLLGCVLLILVGTLKASGKKENVQKAEQKEQVPKEVAEQIASSEIETTAESETPKERIQRVRKEAIDKDYPKDIIKLLKKNPETVDFVENFEEKKDLPIAKKVQDSLKEGEIPQLLQWDERWGYATYGTGFVATCGCGPTCLSMVVSGLTKDLTVTPAVVARYSEKKGYIDEDNNTYWELMSKGGKHWGVSCYEGSIDEESVKAELKAGHPIICSVGPGDFTKIGHFIVLTGYKNGKVTVNDPFSQKNSDKMWKYSRIKGQIKALWVYSVD